MFKKVLMLVFALCLMLSSVVSAEMQQKPAAFIVQDYSGQMEGKDYKDWKTVTRWAYRFPYYQLMEGKDVTGLRQDLDVKVIDRAKLLDAATNANVDVIVLVRVYDLTEYMETARGSMENGPFVKVEAEADLICYRRDSGKLLIDKVCEREWKELGTQTPPGEIIKWRLCDLVNTMEGRELIR